MVTMRTKFVNVDRKGVRLGALTGGQNREQTQPRQPGNAPEGLDTAKQESQDRGNRHPHCRTGSVARDGIQTDGETQHAGASDKSPP